MLVIVTVFPYLSSLRNEFVGWDDDLLIVNNATVHEWSGASIKTAFTSYDPELYIPLTLVSYQLNHLLGELDPFMYHFTNLLLHVANVLLVSLIVVQLGFERKTALLMGALFALHPLNTEAVVWASARKDVLSACFALLSIASYLRYHDDGAKRWLVTSLFFFLLALLSGVTVALLPLTFLLIDWYRGRPMDRLTLGEKIPFAILSAIFIVVAMMGKSLTGTLFLWEKFLIGFRAVTLLLAKFLLPIDLSVLYPYTQPLKLGTPDLFLSILIVALIFAGVIILHKRFRLREPLFAWAWFLLLLLPTFNNATKGRNESLDVYITSDRYAYLPMIGILVLIGFLLERYIRRFPMAIISGFLLILMLFAILTIQQSLVWRNSLSLFRHVARVQPDAYVAHTNVGTELFNQGKTDEALEEYRKALKIRSDGVTWYNAGQILILQGKKDNAMEAFRKAIKASPLEIDAHLQLARLLLEKGENAEALRILEAAKETAPERADIVELMDYIAGQSL